MHFLNEYERELWVHARTSGKTAIGADEYVKEFRERNTVDTSKLSQITPDDVERLELNPINFHISTFRTSSNVNQEDTAVLLKHIPTGSIAVCAKHKSKLQNIDSAMEALKILIKTLS